jgi:hypothetical protein
MNTSRHWLSLYRTGRPTAPDNAAPDNAAPGLR